MNKNPFGPWQLAKQESREKLVEEFIKYLGTSRVRFEYVTDLAVMVAKHVSEHEGKKCSPSTFLRRKSRYKGMLLSYMARSRRPGTDSVSAGSISDPLAQAVVLTAEIHAANLKREVERLKSYIQELEKPRQEVTFPRGQRHATRDEDALVLRKKYVTTCQALHSVLQHFEPLLRADAEGTRIVDGTTRPAKVVVDDKRAEAFFEWLRLNRDVGGTPDGLEATR